MNQKFKLKVFAVLVTFSSSLLGHCRATQQDVVDQGYLAEQGRTQRVTQAAFGAVTQAVPPVSYTAEENYPPIVSASEAANNPPFAPTPSKAHRMFPLRMLEPHRRCSHQGSPPQIQPPGTTPF